MTRHVQFAADSELDRAIAAFEYDHIAAYVLLRGGDRTRADGMFVAGGRTVPHQVEEGPHHLGVEVAAGSS